MCHQRFEIGAYAAWNLVKLTCMACRYKRAAERRGESPQPRIVDPEMAAALEQMRSETIAKQVIDKYKPEDKGPWSETKDA